MENLGLMFGGIYKNKKVLITGHTGFKGSWLSLWLKSMGAIVYGVSLPPDGFPCHWDLLKLEVHSEYADITKEASLRAALLQIKPDIIFHLAAQSLVRRSYREPIATWETNVLGTANLLNICRDIDDLLAIVVVTTDKCYQNQEWFWGYRESDPIGGHDPYSASKAGAELVTESFRRSFFNTPNSALLASARGGNVIGGGDWSEDRLIPDLVKSIIDGKTVKIRSPNSTRPWQHILDCLSGYLQLGQFLLEGHRSFAEAWNFGPDRNSNRQVIDILKIFKESIDKLYWVYENEPQPHESRLLYLDSSKARERLDWKPVMSFSETIQFTAEWYREWIYSKKLISEHQLEMYLDLAHTRGTRWVSSND